MLSPEYLKNLPEPLISIIREMEDYIIGDIARRLNKVGEATSTAEIQRVVLQELGGATKEINKKIAKVLNVGQKEVERMFLQSTQLAVDNQIELFEQAGIMPDYKYFEQIASAAISQAQGDFTNLTKTMGFTMNNGQFNMWAESYRMALTQAQMQVVSGGVDYNAAIRNIVKQFTGNGITTIGYASGKTFTIESAVRMCVINGVSELSRNVSEKNADELGTDGWEISAHADCAPDHIDIQGKQYTNKEYERLNSTIARAIGTLGCRHNGFPVMMGNPIHSEDELSQVKANNEKGITYEGRHYTLSEASQMQRRLERSIRKAKREIIAADALKLKDDFTTKSIKIRRLREYYADFSKKAGLQTQNERTQVGGYGKQQSGKVLDAEKQAKISFKNAIKASVALHSPKSGGIIYADRFEADKALRPSIERTWKTKLTGVEKESAYKYTCGSGEFNRPLRGYDKDWNTFVGVGKVPLNNEGAEKYIKGLESAVKKTEGLTQDTWLFRGSDQQSLAGLLGSNKSDIIPSNVGKLNKKYAEKKVNDSAFFSTGVSPDAGFRDKVAYEILVPKGTKGIYAEPFSRYGLNDTTGTWDGFARGSSVGTEAEMILQKGTWFKVIEIKEISGRVIVILEVN